MSRLDPILETAAPLGTPATRRTWLRWTPAVLAVTVAVFLLADNRNHFKCHQDCYGPPPFDGYGSQTYQPGHPWTSYADSWQWSVQYGLVVFAILAGLVGLVATLTERRPARIYAVTIVALVAWGVWVLLTPAPE